MWWSATGGIPHFVVLGGKYVKMVANETVLLQYNKETYHFQ